LKNESLVDKTFDAFGNSLNAVSVDQQVQLTADLANGQDREQSFAYLVQIQQLLIVEVCIKIQWKVENLV
jgi:hypothetical protein